MASGVIKHGRHLLKQKQEEISLNALLVQELQALLWGWGPGEASESDWFGSAGGRKKQWLLADFQGNN